MPTVILLDVSLSMCRTIKLSDTEEKSVRSLATVGLTSFMEALNQNCKLEFVSLMLFSSLWEKVVPFTRDHEAVKAALVEMDNFYDKTNVVNALGGVKEMVIEDWGSQVPINVVLVTDGYAGISAITGAGEESAKWPLPFPFPCKLNIVCIGSSADPALQVSFAYYEKLIEQSSAKMSSTGTAEAKLSPTKQENGKLWLPEGGVNLSLKSIQQMFTKLAEANYQTYKATLHCGSLSSPVSLFPPMESTMHISDFETVVAQPSNDIEIYGFMPIADVASPPVHSRHLVFSVPLSKDQVVALPSILTIPDNGDRNAHLASDIEESLNTIAAEDGKQPSLCVLLHGSLKVEGMVAVCKVGDPDWYGILYSWADSKKKFNLMLSTFNCGRECVKWLGDIKYLGSPNLSSRLKTEDILNDTRKKSYSQSVVVWVKQGWLQSDIQKIIRLAKRLPDKTANFYKELSKFRRAAFASGFYQAIDGLAALLERECTILPGNAPPEAAMQLTHAIGVLRSRDIDINSLEADVMPLKTKFDR